MTTASSAPHCGRLDFHEPHGACPGPPVIEGGHFAELEEYYAEMDRNYWEGDPNA